MIREAMPFQIQAIFLIHKASGLVIAEVQHPDQHLESEMLAGMLTAIRGFVNDCISQSGGLPLELDGNRLWHLKDCVRGGGLSLPGNSY